MPHRRKRPHGKRPKLGVACFNELIRTITAQTGDRKLARRWIREWLIENKLNRGLLVPSTSPFTLITSLRILNEYPWQAMANVAALQTGRKLRVIVAIGDSDPTTILLVDEESKKILIEGTWDSCKLRFKDHDALILWMDGMAQAMIRAVKEAR